MESSLLTIGNTVETALKVDTITAEMIKARYARVCVELNLQGPLLPNVLVWGRKQPIEYEGLHHICFLCGRYGHKKDHCPTRQSSPEEPTSASIVPRPQPPGSSPAQPFGVWMLPAHVRRKQQLLQNRMNHRAPVSDANRRLNRQIEEQLRADRLAHLFRTQTPDPRVDGSPPVVSSYRFGTRGTPNPSETRRVPSGLSPAPNIGGPSHFSALDTMAKASPSDTIQLLKQ